MSMTSRERVIKCLNFDTPDRMPREIWCLPYAVKKYPEIIKEISGKYPSDFGDAGNVYRKSPRARGDAYQIGDSIDEWGCSFVNLQYGIIGEVKEPLVDELENWKNAKPPYEILPENAVQARDAVNAACAADKFVRATCCPRPWERYQFLRGSENAMMDVMEQERSEFKSLIKTIHDFYLRELEFWVKTDVDAIMFMDDWGSQRQLLIPPRIWREVFKPLYKDYCDLARGSSKFVFMHSDGHISEIYDDLIEIGVDALNSQLFCMDMDDLQKRAKGRITFWGEIDRQHILPSENPQDGRDAVRRVAKHFYDPRGGIIAQFEFGPGANPETVKAVLDEWNQVEKEHSARV
jgi:uroporphyrinogen decarboxylase